MITASRYHDFSCGHRVFGHESKCAHLHGHNYRVTFHASADFTCPGARATDAVGRVIDFGVLKATLCEWLEKAWDHRLLIWEKDPIAFDLLNIDQTIVIVPFNPTAENMADFLLRHVGPMLLPETVRLVRVDVEETRKCQASASL